MIGPEFFREGDEAEAELRADVARLEEEVERLREELLTRHAEARKQAEEIERLRKELAGADRIANDWAKQNVELRRLLRFFLDNVPDGIYELPMKQYEGYADVMKRTEEILGNR